MEREQEHIDIIKQQGILPLFYHDDPVTCTGIAKALYDAGIRVIEFTNRGAKALENFKLLVKERTASMPGLLLAAGTIKTAEHATQFIDAGADVLISPVFDSAVCDVAYMHKVLWIPGCMTPTEIHVAQQAGCRMIKLFPGNLLTPSFIEAIRPLFSGLDYVVTGGVEADEKNMAAWYKAGASGLGLGSKLITPAVMNEKKYDDLTTAAKQALAIVHTIRR